MADTIEIVHTIDALRAKVSSWRKTNNRVGLVPTMGGLHEGHFSLVARSYAENDRTCVTIFVNPRQFGPGEDLQTYPRNQEKDIEALEKLRADLVFAPNIHEMYPVGNVTKISVPGVSDLLEGIFRPGFFEGVVTVVTKLLIQVLPDRAYFGEKDYQQLFVIKRAVADLDIPVAIVGCPTVRESDGLAMSSRNSYLTQEQRSCAPSLNRVLVQTGEQYYSTRNVNRAISSGEKKLLELGFSKVDYIAICNPNSLNAAENNAKLVRVLGAAWLGETRLIDNIEI